MALAQASIVPIPISRSANTRVNSKTEPEDYELPPTTLLEDPEPFPHELHDSHLRETRQREAITATEFERTVMQSQRELQKQLDQINHTLATRLGEIEARLGPRSVPVEPVEPATDVPVRDQVRM